MPHYRDLQGQIHFLDDEQYEGLLPAGSQQITDDEACIMQAPTNEQLAFTARARRDALITATDYLLMRDYPVDDKLLVEVKAYRQALRDVPLQVGFPHTIDWPVKPDL